MLRARAHLDLARLAAVGALLGATIGLIARELDFQAVVSGGSRRPSLVVLASLVGLLIGSTRLRWLLVAATAAMGALWAVVAFTPLSPWLARDLVRRELPVPADAIVVCASRIQPNGEPNVEALSRLVTGAELLARGYAPRLIVPAAKNRGHGYLEAATALIHDGHRAPEILTVEASRNTRQEALRVAQLCRERGWPHVIVVTSPFHSRRAAAAFEAAGLRVTSCPAIEPRFNPASLRRSDESLRAFGGIVHEKLGLWIYRRRGWIAAGKTGG